MTKIQSVMQSQVVTVSPTTTVTEAIELLMKYKISGVPVVVGNLEPVGMLTEKDLLNIFSEEMSGEIRVEQLMSRTLHTFQVTDSLEAVCDCLLANHFRRVMILDGKKLVGLISRADLMPAILEVLQERNRT